MSAESGGRAAVDGVVLRQTKRAQGARPIAMVSYDPADPPPRVIHRMATQAINWR